MRDSTSDGAKSASAALRLAGVITQQREALETVGGGLQQEEYGQNVADRKTIFNFKHPVSSIVAVFSRMPLN